MRALVLKFGGSATTTLTGLNPNYLKLFFAEMDLDLTQHFDKAVFVVGGGERARLALAKDGPPAALQVTREHAGELKTALRGLGLAVCETIPTTVQELQQAVFPTRFGVAVGGLELGQSTDAVAMSAAQVLDTLGYEVALVVLSNIPAIYTHDPRRVPDAKQIARATLEQLVQLGILVDDPAAFRHGMNVPLDPVAVWRYGAINYHPLYFAGADDAQGVKNFLTNGEQNSGTLIKRGESLCLR